MLRLRLIVSCGSRAAVVLEGPKVAGYERSSRRRGTSGAHAASGQGTNPRRSLAMTYVMTLGKSFQSRGKRQRCRDAPTSFPPILPSLALITHLIKENIMMTIVLHSSRLALHIWQDMEYMDDYNDCHPIRNEASDFLLTQKHFSVCRFLSFFRLIHSININNCTPRTRGLGAAGTAHYCLHSAHLAHILHTHDMQSVDR